jgi:hypothetical protein
MCSSQGIGNHRNHFWSASTLAFLLDNPYSLDPIPNFEECMYRYILYALNNAHYIIVMS